MEIAISLWHLIGRSLQDVGCNSHGQSFGSYGCMVLVTFKSLFFVEQIEQFDSATLWLTSWMGRYTMHIHHCNGPSFPSFPSFPIHELSQEICISKKKSIHFFLCDLFMSVVPCRFTPTPQMPGQWRPAIARIGAVPHTSQAGLISCGIHPMP